MGSRTTDSAFSEHLFEYGAVAARRLALSGTITAGVIVFSAHAELAEVHRAAVAGSLVADIGQYLAHEYPIIESTIQATTPREAMVCDSP